MASSGGEYSNFDTSSQARRRDVSLTRADVSKKCCRSTNTWRAAEAEAGAGAETTGGYQDAPAVAAQSGAPLAPLPTGSHHL